MYPKIGWRNQNIYGQPLPGFRNLPEFTFMCPNNPEARTFILAHTEDIVQKSLYDGIFLDRMRYPSCSADPVNSLSCFCTHCRKAALEMGLDLEIVRQTLIDIDEYYLLHVLCGEPKHPLSTFFDFRQRTITQFIFEIVEKIRSASLDVGLDCFSSSLTRMVGQDLGSLVQQADWTKIMIYGHAFGPATLPFELTNLANWLKKQQGISDSDALAILCEVTNIPLSNSLNSVRELGLSPSAIAFEYMRGRQMVDSNNLLAGIELLEIPGVSELNSAQIKADLLALKAQDVGGLSLSWDLWNIPFERLELISTLWLI